MGSNCTETKSALIGVASLGPYASLVRGSTTCILSEGKGLRHLFTYLLMSFWVPAIAHLFIRQFNLLITLLFFSRNSGQAIKRTFSSCDAQCNLQTLQIKWGAVYPYPSKNVIPTLRFLDLRKGDTKPEYVFKNNNKKTTFCLRII